MFPNDDKPTDQIAGDNPALNQPQSIPQQPAPVSQTVQQDNSQLPIYQNLSEIQAPINSNNVVFGQSNNIANSNIKNKKPKKILFISILASVLIIGGASGYVFGFYIPSKPENVYKKAMDRTAKALTEVVGKTSSKQQLDRYNKSQFAGNVNVDFSPVTLTGNMDLKYDEDSLDFSLDAKMSTDGQTEKNYKTHILAEQDLKLGYPDIYFIFDGFSDLGFESFIPGINKLENTWIKVDKNYIKKNVESLKSQVTNGADVDATNEAPDVINEDIEQLTKISTDLVNQYVMTNNPDNAILVNKRFVGKENVDGVEAYHYVMGFNKDNLVKACIDTASRYLDSSVYKKFTNASERSIKDEKEQSKKSCEDGKKDIKDDEEFDMWVDAKYKLIYKVREVDDKQKGTYIEVGQKYKGGDDLHFFIKYVSKEDKLNGDMTLDINTSTLVSKSMVVFQSDDQEDKGKIEVSFNGKPLDADITLDKPTNPKQLEQVIKDLNLDDSSLSQDVLGIATDLRD